MKIITRRQYDEAVKIVKQYHNQIDRLTKIGEIGKKCKVLTGRSAEKKPLIVTTDFAFANMIFQHGNVDANDYMMYDGILIEPEDLQ